MATDLAVTGIKHTVVLGQAQYGTPQPELRFEFPKGTNYRIIQAALHRVAAQVELKTPARWQWIVQIDNEGSCVYLELLHGTSEEIAYGMMVLREALQ